MTPSSFGGAPSFSDSGEARGLAIPRRQVEGLDKGSPGVWAACAGAALRRMERLGWTGYRMAEKPLRHLSADEYLKLSLEERLAYIQRLTEQLKNDIEQQKAGQPPKPKSK